MSNTNRTEVWMRLKAQWERTRDVWNDEGARAFEAQH